MSPSWTTRIATFMAALILSSASAHAAPVAPASPTTKEAAPTTKGGEIKSPSTPALASPMMLLPDIKKVPPNLVPVKDDPKSTAGSGSERVALIWGFPSCMARPWVVSVVDLGSRAVTTRTLSSDADLPLYVPTPMGGTCSKGTCPTMSVVMPPQSPTLFSGTGTMPGGPSKGLRYAIGTSCAEPPMVTDAELLDWATRLVTARNEAQAATAALRAAGR